MRERDATFSTDDLRSVFCDVPEEVWSCGLVKARLHYERKGSAADRSCYCSPPPSPPTGKTTGELHAPAPPSEGKGNGYGDPQSAVLPGATAARTLAAATRLAALASTNIPLLHPI